MNVDSRKWENPGLLGLLLVLYVAGQPLIGAWHPVDHEYTLDAPSDVDFLYYSAIANTVLDTFPPQNPAFAGVKLTQPWLQFVPAAVLAPIVSPSVAFRLLNLIYLLIFMWLMVKWFPARAGLAMVLMFAASSFPVHINALGVDFIARGFTHVPFFILLTVCLFGRKPAVRSAAIFVAALINGYLMLMVLPFLAIIVLLERNRDWLIIGLAALAGTATASLIIASEVTTRPFYFLFTEKSSAYFAPREMLIHAAPMVLLAILYRQRDMTILLAVAVLFGSFIHYNPFFPVFLVYWAGAMIVVSGEPRFRSSHRLSLALTAILFVSFLLFAWEKYSPGSGKYYPRYDPRQTAALDWARAHTRSTDAFVAVTADGEDLALIHEFRPVYLGFIGHVSHLGLPWQERLTGTQRAYLQGQIPSSASYIYYGPVEKKLFPAMNPRLPTVYKDTHVTIYGRAEDFDQR